MSDKLEVIITGKNGVSRIFAEVTSDATKMGTGVEASSKKASKSLDEVKSRAVEVGAAFGAAIGVTALLGQAYNRQQQEIEGLRRAYGDASDEVIDFTEELQRTTTASNDQAREAALIASTLARNYGFTADEIKQVLQVSADLAAVTGFDLADASQRVSSALRGEAESAEALGLTMNQAAIDRQGLTLTMSNEEAAHFRLNALLDQSAFAEGAAAAKAAEHAGQAQQLVNRLQDVAQSAGGAIGPIGAYASVLGNMALIAPAAGAGAGKVVAGLKAAGNLAGLLGPVGLAGAALAAGAGIFLLTQRTKDWELSAEAAAGVATTLNDAIFQLASGGNSAYASALKEVGDAWAEVALRGATTHDELRKLDDQLFKLNEELDSLEETQANAARRDALKQQIADLEAYMDTLERLTLSGETIDKITQDLLVLFSKPGVDAKAAAKDIEWYFELFKSGAIGENTLLAYIDQTAAGWTKYSTAVVLSAQSQAAFNNTIRETASTLVANSSLIGNVTDAHIAASNAAADDTKAMQLFRAELFHHDPVTKAVVESTQSLATAIDDSATRHTRGALAATKYLDAMSAEAQKADEAAAAIADYARALGQVPAMTDSGAEQFAAGVKRSGTALGDAFRVAVGNTDAIGNQSQQVADWAKELINVRGEHGKIDDLLAKGLITQEQYNKAQSAGTKIFDANAKIQEDILAIQAKQAPWLGQLAKEQQHYMDELARLPENQQALRLAYMDSEESAKALAAANLAAAAANGELGKTGEATATKMITAAAEADPYLRKLLQDMGVISVGADGTISINFDDVENAGASLDDVVKVLEDLRDIIAEAFNITITSNADDQLASLNGIVSLLNNLQDRETTYYVNEVRTGISIGSPSGPSISAQAHGGVIPAAHGFAGGGDILVGEFGPELIRRGGGGIVLPTGATRAQAAVSGLGGLNLTININGDVMDPGKLTETITRELVPAIQLATQQFYDGQGIR